MLTKQISDAFPALMRARVLDAVVAAQNAQGSPVTSHQARTAPREPVMPHARAFTEVAKRITSLGPDERGRVLHAAGTDRKGLALWWVEVPRGSEEA